MTEPLPISTLQTASRFLARLTDPSRICIAVSGGSDSLGALVSLHAANAIDRRHSLHAITIDHDLRPEGAQEAMAVRDLCATLAIEHQIRRWHGEKPKTGLPAKAREARYRLLCETADQLGSTILVTGHTQDDQAETIAMRRARNDEAGRGLAGMAEATLYERHLWILRPFLATSRSALRQALTEQGLCWIDDPTNEDRRYERVRRREDGVTLATREAQDHATQRRTLAAGTAQWIEAFCRLQAGCVVRIDSRALHADADVVVTGLSTLLAVIGGRAHLPPRRRVEEVLTDLASDRTRRLTLSRTLVVAQPEEIWLVREKRGLLPLSVAPGETLVWDGRFQVENPSAAIGRIHPGPVEAGISDQPPALTAPLSAIWPHVMSVSEENHELSGTIITPHIALFDHFLPSFDLPLARAIDRIFRRHPLPASPL